MIIKNTKLYDFLKWLGRYGLPALSTFTFTLSEIFAIKGLAIASATITAVVVLLNSLIGVSNENYHIENKNRAFDTFINEIETSITEEKRG